MSEPIDIWIVRGLADGEGDAFVSAYEDEEEARAEAQRLTELLKSAPDCEEFDINTPEEVWDKYEQERQEWVEKFPFPELACVDYCDVARVPFFRKEVPK